jgi:hypothetical protein
MAVPSDSYPLKREAAGLVVKQQVRVLGRFSRGSQKQSLKIALPWPSPNPRAPVFIWLPGESEGRTTKTRY